MPNKTKIILEPAAQKFADDNAKPPFLPDLGPEKGRETVDSVQSSEIYKPEVDIEDLMVPGGPNGDVSIRIVRPPSSSSASLPVILYIHGAGWVFGNAHTHDRLIRELAVGAEAAIVFLITASLQKLNILQLLKKSMQYSSGQLKKEASTD